MKSFIFLALALFSINSFAILTSFNSNSKDGLGEVKHYDNVFIQVQATDGYAFANGDVAVLALSVDDGMTVEKAAAVTRRPHCVVNETIAASAFGKCQVFGIHEAVKITSSDGTVTAGNNAYISASLVGGAGYVGYGIPAATIYPVGEFLDTSASGTGQVFLRLL